eukprot:CAMPEP_0116994214 /NCGR_PEP_ID=MMETSP0467-20121206/67973_1 /TAXON_ID=283647 /ORGANISM="Mesodinium pulex, Strain SPMC105" /LENGTH=126 /DNA_ID=CAMNT_0004692191 /DNA_START=843 /DNA_END=1225 /DNA_ORIENTATION=+
MASRNSERKATSTNLPPRLSVDELADDETKREQGLDAEEEILDEETLIVVAPDALADERAVVVELLHADVADAAVRAAVGAQDVARDALLEHALEAVVQRIVLRLHAQVDVFPVADFGDHVVVEHV